MKQDKSNEPSDMTALKAAIEIHLKHLPVVPADAMVVAGMAASTTRRLPDASMADAQKALKEIAARGELNPGEFGDLGPDPKRADAIADQLDLGEALLKRLDGLTRDVQARMIVLKGEAVLTIEEALEQIEARERRGLLQPECYDHVHRVINARGEAIVEGRERARALKAAQKAANETAAAEKKTG